jgi:S-layer homology domain
VPDFCIKLLNKTTQQPPYLESLPTMIHSTLQRTATALLSLSLVTATPIFSTISLAQSAPTRIAFRDAGSWADPFISPLADRGIISGFQDQTFRPEALVNRAQFAVMLVKAFPTMSVIRGSQRFADVPSNYWAASLNQAVSLDLSNLSVGKKRLARSFGGSTIAPIRDH